MKRKGFTLIELLGVIALLAVIAAITVPVTTGIIKSNKERAYKEQINTLVKAAKIWSVDNNSRLSESDNTFVTPSDLIQEGYIKNDALIDPRNNTEIKGCVKVNFSSQYNQYEFSYQETGCPSPIYEVVIRDFPELELGSNGCKTLDTNKNYTYMGGCYLKGAQTKNYLWYSGFVWRIMGINADKTVRLITEDDLTSISYNPAGKFEFTGSYVDSWLNDYFYKNLLSTNTIMPSDFCQGVAFNGIPNAPRIDCKDGVVIKTKVGLPSMDEYYLAGGYISYLKNNLNFFTMTPYINYFNNNGNSVWYVDDYSNGGNGADLTHQNGVRAVINVDPLSYVMSGNGALWANTSSPYMLKQSKINATTKELKTNALSGEYVKFADKLYRVVSVDNAGNTKLILNDYYNGSEYLSLGYGVEYRTDRWIGKTMNTVVLDWLVPVSDTVNRGKLTDYKWYQNNYPWGTSYTVSLNEVNPSYNPITTAKVGLIRAGEMLSGQSNIIVNATDVTTGTSNSINSWLLTPYSGNEGISLSGYGSANYASYTETKAVRPVIVVNSSVTITGGNGTPSSPYEI